MTTRITDEATLRQVLCALQSSTPDVWLKPQRARLIQQGLELLQQQENEEEEDTACSNWNVLVDQDWHCSSVHAYRRVIPLYLKALELASTAEDSPETQQQLVLLLCQLLQEANSSLLVQQVQQTIASLQLTTTIQWVPEMGAVGLALLWSTSDNDESFLAPLWQDWPSRRDLYLVRTTLFSTAPPLSSPQVWKETIAPSLLRKLKSHPEKALPFVLGWLECLQLKDNDDITKDDALDLTEEWLTVLWHKQANGLATRILLEWTRQSLGAWHTLVKTVASPQKNTTPTQRAAAFALLQTLAAVPTLYHHDDKRDNKDTMEQTIASVLQGLYALLSKETKNPRAGQDTVCAWLVLAQRCQVAYDVAPMHQTLTASTKTKTTLLVSWLTAWVQGIPPDLLESMLPHLWVTKKEFNATLESLVRTATTTKKKSALCDGLVVCYLCLLYAHTQHAAIPSYVLSVLTSGSSFVYSDALVQHVPENPLASRLLQRTVALYTKVAASNDSAAMTSLFARKQSAAARAVAMCVLYPPFSSEEDEEDNSRDADGPAGFSAMQQDRQQNDQHDNVVSSVETILTYQPSAASVLITALLHAWNQAGLDYQQAASDARAQSNANPETAVVTQKYRRWDAYTLRQVGRLLAVRQPNPQSWLLLHAGTTLRATAHQRAALVLQTKAVLGKSLVADANNVAAELVQWACHASIDSSKDEADQRQVSKAVHKSAGSVLLTLGGMASNYSPDADDANDPDLEPFVQVYNLCLQHIAPQLKTRLETTLEQVEVLTEDDVRVYLSATGSLYRKATNSTASEVKKTGKGRLTEEEEWDRQLKQELAAKKKTSGPTALSAEDKKLVAVQDAERERITELLEKNFVRVLGAIRCLTSSDIEVGNSCLPIFADGVLRSAVSQCPAILMARSMRAQCYDALTMLATCVYEIHEMHAPTIAHALMLSCRRKKINPDVPAEDKPQTGPLTVSALPSPCAPAAVCIYEFDEFDDVLSGASFAFIFPVIHACLMGPRTPVGCEAAIKILERHTALLYGEDANPAVRSLRKDMAISVLELLKHDRSQTFQRPSAFETLTACYQTDPDAKSPALTTAELSPLLDERGALGTKNCRVGAMMAISRIATDHRKLVKFNPLVENRIWFNCFDKDDDIRREARKAWAISSNVAEDAPLSKPSPLYAAPLLPLLNHSEPSIAHAAAEAFANALGALPASVSRNAEMLCKTYIESVPTSGSSAAASKPAAAVIKPLKPIAAAPKKKPISTGLPKKTTKKKGALAIAGIGKPKVGMKKKSAVASALLKPKAERTLAADDLVNQFKSASVKQEIAEEKESPEKISVRLGVLNTIAAATRVTPKVDMDEATLKLITSFLMAYGIADSEDTVKNAARDALRDVVASNGGSDEAVAFLLPHLEKVLRSGTANESSLGSLPTTKVPKDISASDRRKEGAVVALGSVALHLKGPENEPKIDSTIDLLIGALKTPSEDVQLSVADALTKLMKKGKTQTRIEGLLANFLRDCLSGETLAVRRGGAYGLSAAVKGSGITTLKKYDIVKKLDEACASDGATEKEGSLFAIELLSSRLGLLFEPYVIVLLPSLLKSFSDSSDHVRTAASNTVGLIMSKLSAHGVKLVMPAVLTAFNDPSWRTKQASIHMLGAMSHLAPKQLASALPKVVPKLTEAFSDTHPKVKASAQEALDEISTVVRNPEISSISSSLLHALTDPADYTIKALEVLIETEFLHAIDAPSLALIVPILHRGLRDRGATTKRYAGLIAGNISTMINDPKDLIPYLPTLLPDLQSALLDPIPDCRSTAAKALGSLTRSLGDHILPELRPWLIKKLRDPGCSSAERSGAGQGLTEVLIASGTTVVEDTMRNEILPLRSHPESSTREGVLWMLSFLPPAMGQGFTALIDISLPALIAGLSDDSEPVRDVAMRAGRVLIRSHGKAHVDKILPSLEGGLGDDDHRIRVASLTLLGDLLSMIGGTSVIKGEGDTQDDIRRAERAQAQIALALGAETRRRVYSGLYMARNDSVHMVRSSALQVWKTVVSVTVRTLRDILPVLVAKIIDDLASGHEEKTVMAGRCLGDVVSKLGDSVLPQIIPVLRNALYDGDEHTKRGVCVGLSEVINCSAKDQLMRFIEIIVKVVQDALSDESESVRKMAASSFQSLYTVVGSRAFDEVVPSLMVALENKKHDDKARVRALNGLTGILSVRSRELLPYIIPRLIQRPIHESHAKALAGVVEVTGGTISHHFSTIIPALLEELADLDDTDEKKEVVRDCSRAVCGFVDESGVNTLVSEIASKCSSDKFTMRRECCRMFEDCITSRAEKADFYEQIPIIIRELLYRLNDEDASVLKANHAAFSALSKKVPAEELVKHVEFMRNLLASMVSDARRRKGGVGDGEFLLPGFNIPKGLEPLIPIYQRGILYGTPTIREVSAAGLGELISLTSTKFLAGPLIVKMTGPLLRIVGDRNPANVKIAILKTLGLVLIKGGPALRAFVPQFQTTFVKALADPSRQVRVEAIGALSLLMPLSTRVDPLIKELVAGSLGKNAPAEGLGATAVQTATLEALATVLDKGGAKAKLPASVPSALDAAKELITSADEGIREGAGKVMGASCALLGAESTLLVLEELQHASSDSSAHRHGIACAIHHILVSKIGSEVPSSVTDSLTKLTLDFLEDDKDLVRQAGAVAFLAVLGRSGNPRSSFKKYESQLVRYLGNTRESMDFHRALARGFCAALGMATDDKNILTLPLLDACLKLALSGTQRVQFAFNDVLWLALDVANGTEGLDKYADIADFENVRKMKSLHSKVLVRIKHLTVNDY